ncbi:MAG: carboxylesterase family protein [Bacteroidaceae bacterium]|nr:carboxylesterase family protein [Bacteroidaceae bacterium]
MSMKVKTLCVACIALAMAGCMEYNPVLQVEGGLVQGVKTDAKGVYVYRGIPYAAPPLGDLRWKEPQPVNAWSGIRLCNSFGHPSFQAAHYPGLYTTEWGYGNEAAYSEDCLYLNVWTNAPGKPESKLPVALFVHGGGFREGWGSEPELDARQWAEKGVITVTFNYRLGVFGFMAHPELSAESAHGVSGNYGLLDMIAALKWIRNNIAQFGGDAGNVTLLGQSAGADGVRKLCESPLSAGLFDKAIIMSGDGLRGGDAAVRGHQDLTLKEAEQNCKEVLDWAGLTNLQKMRAAQTEVIFSLSSVYNMVHGGTTAERFAYEPGITQRPILDNYVSFRSFDNAAMKDSLHHVTYMIGFTMHDYLGDMRYAIDAFCLNRDSCGDRVYAYQFARPLPTEDGTRQLEGAFHSADLWYVFASMRHSNRPWTKGDANLSNTMLTAWTNFAKTGNPGLSWEPYTKENQRYMIFKLDDSGQDASAMGFPLDGNNVFHRTPFD